MKRRSKPPNTKTFPAHVRGKDVGGQRFREETRIENLSLTEGQLRLSHEVEQGAMLFVVVLLPGSVQVVARVVARHVEAHVDSGWSVSIMIKSYRVI